MLRKILTASLVAAAMITMVGTTWAAMINGTLTKIEKEFYTVKDEKGKEHKIHFNDSTKKEGEIKEGAKVSVDEAKGHANSIKVVK